MQYAILPAIPTITEGSHDRILIPVNGCLLVVIHSILIKVSKFYASTLSEGLRPDFQRLRRLFGVACPNPTFLPFRKARLQALCTRRPRLRRVNRRYGWKHHKWRTQVPKSGLEQSEGGSWASGVQPVGVN